METMCACCWVDMTRRATRGGSVLVVLLAHVLASYVAAAHDFGIGQQQGGVGLGRPGVGLAAGRACFERRQTALVEQSVRGLMDGFVPECDDTNTSQYHHTQCYPMYDVPCYCVDVVTGEEIEGVRGNSADDLRCSERQDTPLSHRACVVTTLFKANPEWPLSEGMTVQYGNALSYRCQVGWSLGDGRTTQSTSICAADATWNPPLIGCARRALADQNNPVPRPATTQRAIVAGSWWTRFWGCLFNGYRCNNVWN